MKNKILKILNNFKETAKFGSDGEYETYQAVYEEEFNDVATELVNLFSIHVVSTQSEPFVSLIEWIKNHKKSEELYKETPECIVKYYLKEINGY